MEWKNILKIWKMADGTETLRNAISKAPSCYSMFRQLKHSTYTLHWWTLGHMDTSVQEQELRSLCHSRGWWDHNNNTQLFLLHFTFSFHQSLNYNLDNWVLEMVFLVKLISISDLDNLKKILFIGKCKWKTGFI